MSKQVKSKERVAEHGEVFTAEREVKAMCDLVSTQCDNVDATFLEPACGGGRVYSTGSGNADHTPIFTPTRKMWMGRINVAVRLTGDAPCRLYATADGLRGAGLTIR